jgi:hypothetical protein
VESLGQAKTFWISWARGLAQVYWFLGLYPFKTSI